MSLEASGYATKVLHDLAYSDRLDLVPAIYADSEIWNLRDRNGNTPHGIIEGKIQREAYVQAVRNEPATEKQKEKLRWFGCNWDEGITKGQASDALDECVKHFPERNTEYYKRPATDEQLSTLRTLLSRDGETPEDYAEEDEPLTYERAKDLIWECEMDERQKQEEEELAYLKSEAFEIERAYFHINYYWPGAFREITNEEFERVWALAKSRKVGKAELPQPGELIEALYEICPEFRSEPTKQSAQHNPPTEAQINSLEGGLKLDRRAKISAEKLDVLLSLEAKIAREVDMELLTRHGITVYSGDAFTAYGLADLIRCFEKICSEEGVDANISIACVAATEDPDYLKATISLDESDRLVFTWPKKKLKEWYRKGAE